MLTEADIEDALRGCYARLPGQRLPLNIVDLGLVDAVEITPDADAPGTGIPGVPRKHVVVVTLLAAWLEDYAQAQLSAQAANALAGLEEVSRVRLDFAAQPAWTTARMSAETRRALAMDFPILNNRVR